MIRPSSEVHLPTRHPKLPKAAFLLLLFLLSLAVQACSNGGDSSGAGVTIVVNSLLDIEEPPEDEMTLRKAFVIVPSGGTVAFDEALSGQVIELRIVGSEHSLLPAEVYTNNTFQGYAERDYGRSALYARKNITIDASGLTEGITIAWAGGEENPARLLALYGNLTMRNVAITSGYSVAALLDSPTQPYTLARGGGLAVWGIATLENCTISGNQAIGDNEASRDRGTYGGGIYANGLVLDGCIVSGNSAIGYGAAGGGIYSVGGSDGAGINVSLNGCTASGNRVTGQHAYGGGIFSLGGGPKNLKSMRLTNCTVARNLVQDHPDLPQSGQYYYRGGGVYVGGGYLNVAGCTIVENEVRGYPAVFSRRPNMAGGGVAATIGNAHVVENMRVGHSIIVGNTVKRIYSDPGGEGELVVSDPVDLFTGSLIHFYSSGYNLIGRIDFSQILVPVPAWNHLSRKHWPKVGDEHGIALSEALSLEEAVVHETILSMGPDAGAPAVLWYPPAGEALDKIPNQTYSVPADLVGYTGSQDFPLTAVLEELRTRWQIGDFGTEIENLSSAKWTLEVATWPSLPENQGWIAFWRELDEEIGERLGPEILDDEFWYTFAGGRLGSQIGLRRYSQPTTKVTLLAVDQLGNARPSGTLGDIGAIEK